jgi:hypothetical protein
MTKYIVKVPPTREMGSYGTWVFDNRGETVAEAALDDYNSARRHDGLPPLKRMPAGTIYRKARKGEYIWYL